MPVFPLLFGGLMMLASLFPAWGHTAHSGQVYDQACCRSTADAHGGDCHPLPDGTVRATAEGWLVSIKPGDHPLATKAHQWVIPYKSAKIRPATDGQFHICLWPTEGDDRCLYVPPSGF